MIDLNPQFDLIPHVQQATGSNRCNLVRIATIAAFSLLFCCVPQDAVHAQQTKYTAEQLKFFETKIRPVLVTECYRCHSPQAGKVEGGLRVDTAQSLRLGGDSGPAIDLNDMDDGTLWQAINYDGFEMPPNKKLPSHVIDDFQVWLEAGAADPRKLEMDQAPNTVTAKDIEDGRKFWSFSPVQAAKAPITTSTWPKTGIDQFIVDTWQKNQLPEPNDTDSYTLLRRLCFDLLGVPPTTQQVDWFQDLWAKDQESAISQAVDRMLASPKFGERWGRHWLDIARYAESTGHEVNVTFPQAWRYRDYVIDSFNNDKPYDRFLKEQLVGDLLPANTDQQWSENLIATGFLALGPKTLNQRSARQFSADLVDEQIDVTTRSILGVSVACARCHDHKFEAITQKDYYALAGIFGNMETYFGGTITQQNRNISRLIELPIRDTNDFDRGMTPEQIAAVKSEIQRIKTELTDLRRQQAQARREAGKSPATATNPQEIQRMVVQQTTVLGGLQAQLDTLGEDGQVLTLCMGVQPKENLNDAPLLARGEVDQPGDKVPRGFVQVLARNPPKISNDSSGRLEFANWVADPSNPLTARVMANRIWAKLIGDGIVRTPEDFGVTGTPPTHPELLDHLAKQFVNSKWSVKSLIREIVTSRVYRISSDYNQLAADKDPENYLLWRLNPRRVEAESLRDSVLLVSGQLDNDRPRASIVAEAGPSIVGRGQPINATVLRLLAQRNANETSMSTQDNGNMSQMAPAMRQRLTRSNAPQPVIVNEATINQNTNFRSVYLPILRDSLPRILDLFDAAEPSMVIGVREESNTATQALFMMNNSFMMENALAMAKQATESHSAVETQISMIYKSAYSRPASSEEVQMAKSFIQEMANDFASQLSTERAKTDEAKKNARNRRANNRTSAATVQDGLLDQQSQLKALGVFCQSVLASAEFRYRN